MLGDVARVPEVRAAFFLQFALVLLRFVALALVGMAMKKDAPRPLLRLRGPVAELVNAGSAWITAIGFANIHHATATSRRPKLAA